MDDINKTNFTKNPFKNLNNSNEIEKEPLAKKICFGIIDSDSVNNNINKSEITNLSFKETDETFHNSTISNNFSSERSVKIPPLRHSPKKRLNLLPRNSAASSQQTKADNKKKFRFGNYNHYYSYRNLNDFQDVRLDILAAHKEFFDNQICLDIGCNSGMITIEIAKKLNVKHITGLDIDKTLINKVCKFIEKKRKYISGNKGNRTAFPFNLNFIHGNYVLRNDILLEIEQEQFDVILCLSVTKWIHLNFGDFGLKQAFKRMYLQLKSGGKLILEAQPWNGYSRRKNLAPEIKDNYKNIKFFPKDFAEYLLSNEIGFNNVIDLGVPEHKIKGFQRSIQVFFKA